MEYITYEQHKGMNRRQSKLNMTPEWLYDLHNLYLTKENEIAQRAGITKYNAVAMWTTPTIRYLYPAKWDALTSEIPIARASTAWWHYTTATATDTNTSSGTAVVTGTAFFSYNDLGRRITNLVTGSSAYISAYTNSTAVTVASNIFPTTNTAFRIEAGFGVLVQSRTNDAQGMACMANDTLIMVDGGAPIKSTYSSGIVQPVALTADASAPQDSTACFVHNSHLILNSVAAPQKVYVSALGSITDFSTANDALTLDLDTYLTGGDSVIGFASFLEDYLVILMKKHIVIFNAPYDTTDWTLQMIIPTGAITAYGTGSYARQLLIPGKDGVNTLSDLFRTQEGGLDDITKNVMPLYKSNLDTLLSANWKYIQCGISRLFKHYYICFPLSAGHEILVYSFDHNEIVGRWTGYSVYAMTELEDGTLLIGSTSGQVYTMNSGTTDDGTTITSNLVTPYLYLTNPANFKVVREFSMAVEHSAALTLSLIYDWTEQAGATSAMSASTNAIQQSVIRNSNVLGRGRGISVTVRNAANAVVPIYDSFGFGYEIEGIK